MFAFLLQGLTLGLSAAATPGPFQAYLLSQALRSGWRRTLPVAFVPLISDGPIILAMLWLLTRLPEGFLQAIQIIGGLFLIYLAWGAYQTFKTFAAQENVPRTARPQTLLKGIMMIYLSPGVYLYWSLVTGPILLSAWRAAPLQGIVFLLSFYGTVVGGNVLLALLFGTARQLGPAISRALIGFSALALLGFGLYQLAQGILA